MVSYIFVNIGSDYGLSHVWHQAIPWTLSVEHWRQSPMEFASINWLFFSSFFSFLFLFFEINFRDSYLEHVLYITFRWIPQDYSNHKPTLIQVMAWRHKALSAGINELERYPGASLVEYPARGSMVGTSPYSEGPLIRCFYSQTFL